MRNPKWQIYRGRDKQYRFRLLARNGRNILSGEGYRSKAGCWNGIRAAKKNAVVDKRYLRKAASGGRSYFVLVSPNGKTIGVSQRYASKRLCEAGIRSVRRNAKVSVEDIS
jgi:hypothetical protein